MILSQLVLFTGLVVAYGFSSARSLEYSNNLESDKNVWFDDVSNILDDEQSFDESADIDDGAGAMENYIMAENDKYDEDDGDDGDDEGDEERELIIASFLPLASPSNDLTVPTKHYNSYVNRLLNKDGLFLAVTRNGKVYGVHGKSRNTVFHILMYGNHVVRLQNNQTKKYIAVNSCGNGKLVPTSQRTKASLFKVVYRSNYYESFRSLFCTKDQNPKSSRKSKEYLGLQKNGRTRGKATLLKYNDSSAMFQLVD